MKPNKKEKDKKYKLTKYWNWLSVRKVDHGKDYRKEKTNWFWKVVQDEVLKLISDNRKT